ncbi:MAG: SMP-30/gluconolactonase/LRE family protein [Pegethrix bostrychoides GSE-TBD4-15B]|jgi:sugar lactone lactonase YvrE|uniref:SMP-30/gluconolactonase/LRE family protein n=1 Tax=Pegethrix bostrychoides GSE-TBD4-15B TaxID=2839662 RepID=A0A951PGN4_9CYAN|nr:SMP-30/gluconolactonase/LRE family protein [Pegethrix bostrychoides GSE-TBD4-15B]
MANQLPAIFAQTPVATVPARTIAEFPVNTFLENIVVNSIGTLFVTSYEEGKIYVVTPDGQTAEFAKVEGLTAGIALEPSGCLLVSGVASGVPAIFRIAPDGVAEILVTLPDAIFLNGMTAAPNGCYWVADSYKGAIWEIDAAAKTARIWLQDERLARSNPDNPFPAVNGIKLYQNALYASNTERQQLIKIPLAPDFSPGAPQVILEPVNLDDFAFDAAGNLYGTTHVYNSVVRVSPELQVTILATAAEGMTGSTALAFGRSPSDSTSLYVVTNGGMSLPPETGVGNAQVVRLEVGAAGV